jgi:hypothetical protein
MLSLGELMPIFIGTQPSAESFHVASLDRCHHPLFLSLHIRTGSIGYNAYHVKGIFA